MDIATKALVCTSNFLTLGQMGLFSNKSFNIKESGHITTGKMSVTMCVWARVC